MIDAFKASCKYYTQLIVLVVQHWKRNTVRLKSKDSFNLFLPSKLFLFLVFASPYSAIVTGTLLLHIRRVQHRGVKTHQHILYIQIVQVKCNLFFYRCYMTQNVVISNIQTLLKIHYILFFYICK